MKVHKSDIKSLLLWFKDHKRDLPWRIENPNRDPYRVWISEVMLQQTQVTTVIPFFIRWINTFPNVESLANAKEEDVIAYWAGLGYYSRARNLQKGAKFILSEFKGAIPSQPEKLLEIPGVGEYTAGAISSLAFDENSPILDGNLIRIFSRFYNSKSKFWDSAGKKLFWNYSSNWILRQSAKSVNEALMELGALVCRPKSPNCTECPINKNCLAFKNNNAEAFPIKRTKVPKVEMNLELVFLKFENKVFCVKGLKHLLSNEWMPISFEESEHHFFKKKISSYVMESWSSNDLKINHSITHHKIKVGFSYLKLKSVPSFLKDTESEKWVDEKDFQWTSSLVHKCLKKIEG